MSLTQAEQKFLAGHRLAMLATVGPDGGPQNKPVGYAYNDELGTIDIYGLNMAQSAKYRNVARQPLVALVVDDPRVWGRNAVPGDPGPGRDGHGRGAAVPGGVGRDHPDPPAADSGAEHRPGPARAADPRPRGGGR